MLIVMKKIILFVVAFISSIFINIQPIDAQVVVKIRPVPPHAVARPHVHRHGHVWIEPEWVWKPRLNAYVWKEGRWVKPRRHAVWIPGHWVEVRDGHNWVPLLGKEKITGTKISVLPFNRSAAAFFLFLFNKSEPCCSHDTQRNHCIKHCIEAKPPAMPRPSDGASMFAIPNAIE